MPKGVSATELGKTAPLFQGVTDVYVICNTFHVEEKFMQQVFANKLHSVPALTSQAVVGSEYSKPLIVGSKLTSEDNLYSHAGYIATNMFADELIAAGMKYQTSHPQLTDVVAAAERAGSDCIVLGCTDLSVMADTLRTMTALPVIDSVEAVANHIYNSHTKDES
jgi:aspartate/glutamate racemase